MSLTDEIERFLKIESQTYKFCKIVGINEDALSGWLLEKIEPSNIHIFFDFGIVIKDEAHKEWCDEFSSVWSSMYEGINKRREQYQIESLSSLAFDKNAPKILQDIAMIALKKYDNQQDVENAIMQNFIKRAFNA